MADDTLYDRLVAAGFEIDHHQSDLYVRVTPESRAIIDAWSAERGHGQGLRTEFVSEIDNERYFDVPFAYQPWWDEKAALDAGRNAAPEAEEEPSPPSMGM